MTGCTETSCAVQVGQLLSARKILVGTVMKMGNKIVISGRIVDVEKGIGERAANQSVTSVDELYDAAGKFTRTLIGQ
jgi:TolB-like protein